MEDILLDTFIYEVLLFFFCGEINLRNKHTCEVGNREKIVTVAKLFALIDRAVCKMARNVRIQYLLPI